MKAEAEEGLRGGSGGCCRVAAGCGACGIDGGGQVGSGALSRSIGLCPGFV
jgi:hypothetical protein